MRERSKKRRKAGHRSWAAAGAPVMGEHQGDIMSPETRSAVMSRIRGKDTGPERAIRRELKRRKVYFSTHAKDLPGRPDIVFRRIRLAVFIDGDFWHGWRFPLWQHKLSPKWRDKIAATRQRDQKNFTKLRRMGWTVIRIWEHQVEASPHQCADRILKSREDCLSRLSTANGRA